MDTRSGETWNVSGTTIIVVFGYVLCNILYCIVESFSLIRGRRHGWPNHVKTSCTVCVIVLSLCS